MSDNLPDAENYLREQRMLEQMGWPPALRKALSDPYEYTFGLRDGSVIHCTHVRMLQGEPEWVIVDAKGTTLIGPLQRMLDENPDIAVSLARGLEIRVSDVVWAIDGYK